MLIVKNFAENMAAEWNKFLVGNLDHASMKISLSHTHRFTPVYNTYLHIAFQRESRIFWPTAVHEYLLFLSYAFQNRVSSFIYIFITSIKRKC